MASLVSAVKLNPAVVAGVLSAIGIAVAEGDFTTWQSLAAVIVGVIVRQFVTPTIRATAQVAEAEATAFAEGVASGQANGPI